MQQAKTTPVDMALLAVAEQILRLNGYEVEAGAVARIVDDVGRLRAECEQLRQVLRQTLLTYVVADDAYDSFGHRQTVRCGTWWKRWRVNEGKGYAMTKWTKPEYRVVRDNYCGYEVQIRRWWHWPFWLQAWPINTHLSVEAAEKFAEEHARWTA